MKLKNFQPHNRPFYYFFPGWNALPFFGRKSKSLKHSLTFPSDHSPNRLIPPAEVRRSRRFGLRAFGMEGFFKKFFRFGKEEL